MDKKRKDIFEQHIIAQNRKIQNQWLFLIIFCVLFSLVFCIVSIVIIYGFSQHFQEQIPEGEWECVNKSINPYVYSIVYTGNENDIAFCTDFAPCDSGYKSVPSYDCTKYQFVRYGDEE